MRFPFHSRVLVCIAHPDTGVSDVLIYDLHLCFLMQTRVEWFSFMLHISLRSHAPVRFLSGKVAHVLVTFPTHSGNTNMSQFMSQCAISSILHLTIRKPTASTRDSRRDVESHSFNKHRQNLTNNPPESYRSQIYLTPLRNTHSLAHSTVFNCIYVDKPVQPYKIAQ